MKLFAAAVCTAAIAFEAAPAGAASTNFVQTNTLGYTAAEYTDLGPAAVTLPLRVVVGLTPRNAASINPLLERMSTPGDPLAGSVLTSAQTTAMFGQTRAAADSVVSYLTGAGFANVRVSPDLLLVTATATAGQAQTAFATQIDAVRLAGYTTFANVKPAYVPASLGGIVTAVEGLSGASMHSDLHAAIAGSCTPVVVIGRCIAGSLNAGALGSLYDTAGVAPATQTTLAIVAAGNISGLAADVATAERTAGVTAAPLRTVATGPVGTDTELLADADLAAQSALTIAAGAARVIVYDAPSLAEADITAAIDRFESDDAAAASSIGFGICEDVPSTDGAMLVDDTLLALAALHGQTLFAAAGDVLAGCAAQQYPASSPYAVAVGATTPLVPSIGSGPIGEVAWTLTAGGPSDTEAAPFWQANIAPAAAAAADARAVPDITLDGDPNTGTPTIVRGGGIQLGGTSLGAALALGLWGRLETGQHNRLGFGSPRLYREFATFRTPADARPNPAAIEQSIGGFRDLLVGTSVVAAGPEDDFASGLGSLDLHLQADDIQP